MEFPMPGFPQHGSATKLGAGGLVWATFRRYLRNFPRLFSIAYVPVTLVNLLFWALIARYVSPMPMNPATESTAIFNIDFFLLITASVLLAVLVQAFVLLAAADVLQKKPFQFGAYVNSLLAVIAPLLGVAIVVYLGIFIGLLLFIVPGVWLTARWSVYFPALVIDREGIHAMTRSADLTKDYRWPIIGAGILIWLVLMALCIGGDLIVLGAVRFDATELAPFGVAGMVMDTLYSTIGYGVMAVFQLLLFSRLVVLKERGSDLTRAISGAAD
jgi:hypothetical protein